MANIIENKKGFKAMEKTEDEKKLDMLMTIMYTGALSNVLLLEELSRQLERQGGFDKYVRERKKLFNQIREHAKAMRVLYTKLEPDYDLAFTDKENGKYSAKSYDDNMRDANELCRLMLLYWDKCFQSEKNMNLVFAHLRRLKGMGTFTDCDIEKFRLK